MPFIDKFLFERFGAGPLKPLSSELLMLLRSSSGRRIGTARRERKEGIALGSASQIALFVAPVLVAA